MKAWMLLKGQPRLCLRGRGNDRCFLMNPEWIAHEGSYRGVSSALLQICSYWVLWQQKPCFILQGVPHRGRAERRAELCCQRLQSLNQIISEHELSHLRFLEQNHSYLCPVKFCAFQLGTRLEQDDKFLVSFLQKSENMQVLVQRKQNNYPPPTKIHVLLIAQAEHHDTENNSIKLAVCEQNCQGPYLQ